jgi:hypothetical protein
MALPEGLNGVSASTSDTSHEAQGSWLTACVVEGFVCQGLRVQLPH